MILIDIKFLAGQYDRPCGYVDIGENSEPSTTRNISLFKHQIARLARNSAALRDFVSIWHRKTRVKHIK